jgi:hypothetical protein
MALRTPPSWLQNGSHTAENDRLTTTGSLWGASGVVRSADLAVTAPGGTMTVSVASGWAAILGTYQTNMGTYMAYNDAATTATITTANPSNPRIDLVCITVNDAAYSGSLNSVAINVVAGTPAGSPTVPSTPTNSIALAQVAVAAGATSITSGNITDVRVRAQIIEPTISSASSTAVPLRIVLNSGQTANALQVINSSGTVLNGFDSNGNLLSGAVNLASLEYEFIMGAY